MPSSAVSSILFATFLLLRPCVGSSTSSARDTNENGKNGTAAADAPLLPMPDVLWFAPFFSGGGYCSEAIAFVHALRLNDEVRVGIEQHGDGYSQEFVSGLPASTFNELRQLAATRIRGFGKSHARASHRHSSGGGGGGGSRSGAKRESAGVSVAVCHSEPGAWHPSRWPTARCPPAERGFLAVGRTMFETDRLPDGWPARLREMDQIWVPTEFHRDIFARALRAETSSGRGEEERGGAAAGRSVVDGDEAEGKIRVLGEPVDVDFFDPADFVGGMRQPLRIWEADDSGSGGAAFGRLPTSRNAQGTTEDKLLKASEAAQRPFVFLSVFKWEERKGWDVLLKAFLEEFQEPEDSAASDDRTESKGDIATTTSTTSTSSTSTSERKNNNVVLVILTNAYHSTDGTREFWTQAMKRLGRASPNPGAAGERRGGGASIIISDSSSSPFHPRVVFHPPGVAQADLPALYAGADAFVLPSRGEGWGRPHVEAMAMGLPVIATNWSGPTEFLTPANGYPLALEEEEGGLVPVREGAFRGHLWANPSVAHLRLLMREVVEDPGAAREKGKRARRDMVEKYSPSVLGNRARRLLVELVQDHERQKRNARERQRSQLLGAEL